jgi:hypothetical protein
VISFLQPWVLLALPLATLPLLLHLVQRRDPPSVVFPAVRYLRQVSEEHQRRLRLRHLLLLLVRTALILLLVLAAANPTAPAGGPTTHAPSALVVILDNSPSSGAVARGAPVLTGLKAVVGRVLDRVTPADAVWLMTATGVARRGLPAELRAAADSVVPESRRLDLGEAIREAVDILAGNGRPGGIVVISDLQASAVSQARTSVPITVARPVEAPPANTGVGSIEVGPQPWAGGSGPVVARLTGEYPATVPITVRIGNRLTRNTLASGGTGAVSVAGLSPGWWVVSVAKSPDELRADDERAAVLHVIPPARADCRGVGRHLAAACQVLAESGRLRPGEDIALWGLGRGSSIVAPPEDPAQVGALNRALERRGSAWRFGPLVVAAATTDSGALLGRERVARRHELVTSREGAADGVIATVGGKPWVVRAGDLVLLGSRLEPAWTGLPLSASFPGFVDALVNRVATGDALALTVAVGEPAPLPGHATGVVHEGRRWQVEGGGMFRPGAAGVYFVLAGKDTIGSLAAGIDPQESNLAQADEDLLASLWPGARLREPEAAADAAFTSAGRASLQTPLLWVALLLAGVELLLAAGRRRTP